MERVVFRFIVWSESILFTCFKLRDFFFEFLERFKSKIDSGLFGEKSIADKQALTLSEMIYQFTDKTNQDISLINNKIR